jgi:hypothetical protein
MKSIPSNSQYKSGILFISLIGVSLFLIYFLYSKYTSPGSQVFINNSLYSFALTVLFTSIILTALLFYVIQNTFFSKKNKEQNPQKLIYYLQLPFSTTKFKTIFLISTILYFIFFAFVSNIFIYFDNNGTAFSLFPKFAKTPMNSMNMSSMNMNDNSILNSGSSDQNDDSNLIKYPNSKIIICCNYMGYVPMVIFELNPNFSIFVIPVNTFIGIFVSVLVGINISLNIFLLKQLRSLRLQPSKNVLGIFGIGTGLFVGCPTCAGNLFYSLAGFSSLVAFSSLNTFQIIFVFASIPLLIFSTWFMIKQLRKNYLNTCRLSKSKDIR